MTAPAPSWVVTLDGDLHAYARGSDLLGWLARSTGGVGYDWYIGSVLQGWRYCVEDARRAVEDEVEYRAGRAR